jgi:threonine/homoserine/homoserine lactone efflux protein
MMTMQWFPFLSYVIVMAITPGPNNIMSMNNAARAGFKKAIPFNLGIFAGFTVVMLICLISSSLLKKAIPAVELPMKILCVIYMVYLIIKTFLPSRGHGEKEERGSFFSGALLQLINAKIWIYGITSMSAYILPNFSALPLLLAFAVFLAFTGFVCTLCWALFGSLFNKLFTRHALAVNIIMAVLLFYCAVSLFL